MSLFGTSYLQRTNKDFLADLKTYIDAIQRPEAQGTKLLPAQIDEIEIWIMLEGFDSHFLFNRPKIVTENDGSIVKFKIMEADGVKIFSPTGFMLWGTIQSLYMGSDRLDMQTKEGYRIGLKF